jgi:hypothetical protein
MKSGHRMALLLRPVLLGDAGGGPFALIGEGASR